MVEQLNKRLPQANAKDSEPSPPAVNDAKQPPPPADGHGRGRWLGGPAKHGGSARDWLNFNCEQEGYFTKDCDQDRVTIPLNPAGSPSRMPIV